MNRIGRKVKVIAKSSRHKKDLTAKAGVMTLMISATLCLTGCMGLDVLGGGVDKSISTSTVANQKNPETVSDEMTVSNAVTSADVSKLAGKPLPWANASTGSAGVITAIAEQTGGANTVCRTFQTTRHSYRGIASFSGQTCLRDDGRWQLLSFQEAQ